MDKSLGIKKKVVFLHTSLVFILKETLLFDLMKEILPAVEIVNIVDDGMLREVMSNGRITSEVLKRMAHYVSAAEAYGVDAILNTCSSLGPASDTIKPFTHIPILRIDEGMAEKAVSEGCKIGVLATVGSTVKPTVDIIRAKAEEISKKVEVKTSLAEGAFDLLMKGDTTAHDERVIERANEISGWADCIALAQSSMARLGKRVSEETGLPVYTSPRLGVEHLAKILDQR
jgi:Asp/Glu/hydantoin racemase